MRLGVGVVLSVFLIGCSSSGVDGGVAIATVPGSFHNARNTPGHRAHLAEGLACNSCHDVRDAGFAPPGPALCAGCHEMDAEQHHPFSTTDAGTMTCVTCHVFNSAQPVGTFPKWNCMSCHQQPQGPAHAIGVHVSECAACHRPHELPFTKSAACSDCHDVTLHHGSATGTLPGDCSTCHAPHTRASMASGQCIACHEKPTIAARLRVQPGALFEGGHEGCGSCHPAHEFTKEASKPCTGCHVNHPVLAADKHAQCVSCHQPHQPKSAPVACESCHKTVKAALKHPKTGEGQTCTGCHDPHPKVASARLAADCTSCHAQKPFTAAIVHDATLGCGDCHEPHAGKPLREKLCLTCHAKEVKATHATAGHRDCAGCHAELPHGHSTVKAPCLSCHKNKTPPQKQHPSCTTCHDSHSGAPKITCMSCHLKADQPKLPGLHATSGHQECSNCHAAHTPEPSQGPQTCRGCHQTLSKQEHPVAPKQCVTCHLFVAPK